MSGLFVNDLFNGESSGGPRRESDRGIFRSNLFDGEPLGQTTPALPEPAPDSMFAELARTGGSVTGGKAGSGVTGGAKGPAMPIDQGVVYQGGQPYAPVQSEIPWVPILLAGGASILLLGGIVMLSGRRAPTANRRRVRRNRRRRHGRRAHA